MKTIQKLLKQLDKIEDKKIAYEIRETLIELLDELKIPEGEF